MLWGIGVLYLASVPWYRDSDAAPRLLFGLPDWVAVALACYVGVAVLNSAAWLLADMSDGAGRAGPVGTGRAAADEKDGG